jgi:hypothetical protein
VAAAVAVLLLAGLAVLGTGVVLHAGRIGQLTAGIGAGTVGGIALWAAQAAFLPNIVIWCSSYALGAGFTVGQGSVVAPTGVSLGILPSVPILGALPGTGAGSELTLVWLAGGVAAGVAAALLVVRRRPAARFDETALVGGLAGVLAALVFTALAWTTGGDLGTGRLAGAGPRLFELLVMAATVLGLSGMICGFVAGVVRWLRRRPSTSSGRGGDGSGRGRDGSGRGGRWLRRGDGPRVEDGDDDRLDGADVDAADGADEVTAPVVIGSRPRTED